MIKQWTAQLVAIGASLVLTMRIFSEPPQGRLPLAHVIERVVDETNAGLDPREVIHDRIVLTLPIDRGASPRQIGSRFGLN